MRIRFARQAWSVTGCNLYGCLPSGPLSGWTEFRLVSFCPTGRSLRDTRQADSMSAAHGDDCFSELADWTCLGHPCTRIGKEQVGTVRPLGKRELPSLKGFVHVSGICPRSDIAPGVALRPRSGACTVCFSFWPVEGPRTGLTLYMCRPSLIPPAAGQREIWRSMSCRRIWNRVILTYLRRVI